MLRLLGSVLVLGAASAVGFQMAASVNREVQTVRQLCSALDVMQREIRWNQRSLPQLCRMLQQLSSGPVARMFADAAGQLEQGSEQTVAEIFDWSMQRHAIAPDAAALFLTMAATLGRYDPEQQALAVAGTYEQMCSLCRSKEAQRSAACRRLRLFGVCGGAALVILLL